MAALTLLQKHIRQRDLQSLIKPLAALMLNKFMTGHQVASLVNYMLQAGETPHPALTLRQLARQVPQHEEKLMTIAEHLEQQGIEKGRQAGKREASLDIAKNMLANGLDRELIMNITGLTEHELKQLSD